MIEFKKKVLKKGVAVHCKTIEQAEVLLKWAHEKGLTWNDGESYEQGLSNSWEDDYNGMVYQLSNGDIERYRDGAISEEWKIISFQSALKWVKINLPIDRGLLEVGMKIKYESNKAVIEEKIHHIDDNGDVWLDKNKSVGLYMDEEDEEGVYEAQIKPIFCVKINYDAPPFPGLKTNSKPTQSKPKEKINIGDVVKVEVFQNVGSHKTIQKKYEESVKNNQLIQAERKLISGHWVEINTPCFNMLNNNTSYRITWNESTTVSINPDDETTWPEREAVLDNGDLFLICLSKEVAIQNQCGRILVLRHYCIYNLESVTYTTHELRTMTSESQVKTSIDPMSKEMDRQENETV